MPRLVFFVFTNHRRLEKKKKMASGLATESPTAPVAAADGATEMCSICDRLVPVANAAIHALRCARATTRCQVCNAAVAKTDLEAHTRELHGTRAVDRLSFQEPCCSELRVCMMGKSCVCVEGGGFLRSSSAPKRRDRHPGR